MHTLQLMNNLFDNFVIQLSSSEKYLQCKYPPLRVLHLLEIMAALEQRQGKRLGQTRRGPEGNIGPIWRIVVNINFTQRNPNQELSGLDTGEVLDPVLFKICSNFNVKHHIYIIKLQLSFLLVFEPHEP